MRHASAARCVKDRLYKGLTCCSASAMRGVWGADWVTGADAAAPKTGNRGLAAATLLGDTSARRDVHDCSVSGRLRVISGDSGCQLSLPGATRAALPP